MAPMTRMIAVALCALSLVAGAQAPKPRVEKGAELPRFDYKVDGKVEALVDERAKVAPFATALRGDLQSVLDRYDIADKAAERDLVATLMQIDWLDGRHDAAMAALARLRAGEETAAGKQTSGMVLRAIDAARRATGATSGTAFRAEVARRLRAELDAMPYALVAGSVRRAKSSAELMSEAHILSPVRETVQPEVDRAGSLPSELAPIVVAARYRMVVELPLKATLVETYAKYLAANRVDKPDVWAAREAELPPGRDYKPVAIAIWDSGVDTATLGDRVLRDASGAPALIAFNRYAAASSGELGPAPDGIKERLPRMKARLKGLSDVQNDVDSPEASELKAYLSNLGPDQYGPAIEELQAAGNYMHGTHIASVAVAGNPYARVAIARIEFSHTIQPDPCPSAELARNDARNVAATVEFFKRTGVRVVNMSFGGAADDIEAQLEACAQGASAEARRKLAREIFDIGKAAMSQAIAGAPAILFVAAGRAGDDAASRETVPADLVLPNLLTAGATDHAGEEAPYTSAGRTVAVYANGELVDGAIPGGDRHRDSGAPLAAPQVVNLAAKLLAVWPSLTPPRAIALIIETADKSADGRRALIHPRKALAAAAAQG
jgi:subtilisin family serine protease